MNPDLDLLQPYPFERLARLFDGAQPPAGLSPIALSIGEPQHPAPSFVAKALTDHLDGLARYPLTKGSDTLREAIAGWLERRFGLTHVDPLTEVVPVNGTREALFAFAQAVVDRHAPAPLVAMPNPFYQIYEGAALLAGAEPYFINVSAERGLQPDFDRVPAEVWQRCQLLYLCSPGNPSGAVIDMERLKQLIVLAQQHDFIIAADECYSEIYPNEAHPPPGLLQAAQAIGVDDYARCIVFHSLSKRSNLPGLRSGFVAGDAAVLARFLRYRTYHGCAMAPPVQAASIAAWQDEQHVIENRARYREKFSRVLEILTPVLAVDAPDAGFYLWPQTPIDDERFARTLFERQHVTVLPGRYLSRDTATGNPGTGRVRMALVAELDACVEAAQRIRNLIEEL